MKVSEPSVVVGVVVEGGDLSSVGEFIDVWYGRLTFHEFRSVLLSSPPSQSPDRKSLTRALLVWTCGLTCCRPETRETLDTYYTTPPPNTGLVSTPPPDPSSSST